jgi:CBS-domain-containing membrane protein
MNSTPFINYLNSISLKDLPLLLSNKSKRGDPVQDIVFVESNTSVQETLEVLAKHNLLSVPVRDHQDKFWIGFVDVLDLLNFIIEMYTEGNQVEQQKWGTYCQDITTLTHRGVRFGLKPISTIINESRVDSFKPVLSNGTVYQLIEELLTHKAHRVPVVDDRDNITNIVSQSDIIQLCSLKMELLGPIAKRTVGDLKLGTRGTVMSMAHTAQAIHAFYLMYFHKVMGVAIVLPDGTLLGNISASDIRGLTPQQFSSLLLPVTEYLQHQQGQMKPPFTVTLSSTFETVIQKLALYRVHRLWIVNEKDQPIGVVSLTDIMKFFSSLLTA